MKPVPVWPPTPGLYALRLVRGGPLVAVRIWHGAAVIAGEEQDRAPGWYCEIDGRTDRWDKEQQCLVPLEIDRAWPFCARRPIPQRDYLYMLEHARWTREHRPDDPKARPREPVDFHTLPTRF
jgi:hypothetical protein